MENVKTAPSEQGAESGSERARRLLGQNFSNQKTVCEVTYQDQKAKDVTQEMLAGISPDSHIHILRCLLNYHERMMIPHRRCPGGHCDMAEKLEGTCPNSLFIDTYAEALKEAIRCIEIVHKDELGLIG